MMVGMPGARFFQVDKNRIQRQSVEVGHLLNMYVEVHM